MAGTSLVMDRKSEPVAGHILLVDDDTELCRLVSRFLEAEGYSVQTVQTSRLGVEQALSGSYDLIVLDVMLSDSALEASDKWDPGRLFGSETGHFAHNISEFPNLKMYPAATPQEIKRWTTMKEDMFVRHQ